MHFPSQLCSCSEECEACVNVFIFSGPGLQKLFEYGAEVSLFPLLYLPLEIHRLAPEHAECDGV